MQLGMKNSAIKKENIVHLSRKIVWKKKLQISNKIGFVWFLVRNRYYLVIKRCQLLGAKKELFGVEKKLFGAKIRSFSTNSKFILASSSLCETVKISVCYKLVKWVPWQIFLPFQNLIFLLLYFSDFRTQSINCPWKHGCLRKYLQLFLSSSGLQFCKQNKNKTIWSLQYHYLVL